ncbi:MAG: ferredoxin [Pseudonocardiales bacterium]|jgi:ferredoxin|uniref:ferredoxin n=1 Tax=Pseudonocardia sp. TaxID=60912 RepID=UPI0026304FBF|nr:ferredoxin [Pseudonocardia sp.]MCW2723007.1 putative ferredoxin [Pseudonocardia sp.]MDT7618770.1 ferredoxin [Pseudonocardiales bacterium]MDT7707069.1 ferredoxin [Pseudonocardiales bacterium]
MRISVDPTLCQGHNRCTAVAPELFDIDDEGYASAIGDGTVSAGSEERAQLAVDNCPEQAVTLHRDA